MTAGGLINVSSLVAAGSKCARVVFGPSGTPISGNEILDGGMARFAPGREGSVVGALLTNDQPTLELILGALAQGVTIVSLPMPGRGASLDDYLALLRCTLRAWGLWEVVAANDVAALLEAVSIPTRRHSDVTRVPLAAPGDGFRLVQFTSGSTQQPRPVVLDDEHLGSNVASILAVLQPRPGDAVVSWLPLAHDMGLVGMVLAAFAAGGSRWAGSGTMVLLDPRDFLRRPAVWLEALSHWRGTFTAAPDFAFRHAVQRSARLQLNLSFVRCAIVGGEVVRSDTLASFSEAFAGRGFDAVAFSPAHGMAEVGVAVTLTPPDRHWQDMSVSSSALAVGTPRRASAEEPVTRLVSCGAALPGYEVTTSGHDGGPGCIALRGPSVGADGTTGHGLAGDDRWYATGDAGLVDDEGLLYVTGRIDDCLVANGRNIYSPAVERAVGDVVGVRSGRVTAVGMPNGGWVIAAEPVGRDLLVDSEARGMMQEIRKAAVDAVGARPDDVVIVAPGTLPLTSSGKIQRNEVRARLLRRDLAAASSG